VPLERTDGVCTSSQLVELCSFFFVQVCMLKRTRNVSALLCWRFVHALAAKGLATTAPSDALFGRGVFVATLEWSKSSDLALWSTDAFAGVVVPDLPPVQKLSTLTDWKKLLQACISKQQHIPAPPDGILTVKSVAAQLYGRRQVTGSSFSTPMLLIWLPCLHCAHAFLRLAARLQVRARLAAAAGVDSSGHCLLHTTDITNNNTRSQQQQQHCVVPHALLLLSGSHPLRALWWLRRMDAVAQIKLAAEMKQTGHLPDSVALWAVANPLAADQDAELERYACHKQSITVCISHSEATCLH
jgi:hypothetical protein